MGKSLGTYKYSILRYRHSAFLGESINLGYVVYFEKENKFFFNQTNNIPRISSLYPDFCYSLIKNYLKDIYEIVQRLNKKPNLFEYDIKGNLNLFLNENVFPFDGTSLIFSSEVMCRRHQLSLENVFSYLSDNYIFNKKMTIKKEKLKDLFYDKVKNFVREDKFSKNPNFYKNYKCIILKLIVNLI